MLLPQGLSTKCLREKGRNLFKPQLWQFGNRIATCKEAEWSPREDGRRTWRVPKGDSLPELFQAQAAEADSDLRSKETVLAWFSHTQGKGQDFVK